MVVILEKYANSELVDRRIRKALEFLSQRGFANLDELKQAMYEEDNSRKPLLPSNVYISNTETVHITDLPHIIKELPVYYFAGHGLGGLSKIANVKVV